MRWGFLGDVECVWWGYAVVWGYVGEVGVEKASDGSLSDGLVGL